MVLTGYNTDIDYGGTTYHVQTEDKGQSNPFVESLVYASGEILYSRRTSYEDLLEQDLDLKAVATLMEHQHRTIAEAIRRGRLAQLTGRTQEVDENEDTSVSGGARRAEPSTAKAGMSEPDRSLDQVILDYLDAQRSKAHLILRAAGDHDFVYGASVQVRILAVDSQSTSPQPEVRISVLFKSTAEPRRLLLAEGETNAEGLFGADVDLPPFNGGTSAVVITAHSPLGQSEIKHLVHR